MIQIPYQDRFAGKGSAAVSVVPVGAGNANGQAIARGVQVAADQLGQYGRTVVEQEDRTERAKVALAFTQSQERWLTDLEERKRNLAGDGKGFSDGVVADYDEWASGFLTAHGSGNPQVRAWLEERLADQRLGLRARSLDIEGTRRGVFQGQAVEETAKGWADAAFKAPLDYEEHAAGYNASIDLLDLDPAIDEKLRGEGLEDIALATGLSLAERDPALAYEQAMNGAPWAKQLSAPKLDSIATKAQAELKRRKVEAEQAAREAEQAARVRMHDAQEGIAARLQDDTARLASGLTPESALTQDEVMEAFGPEKGPAAWQKIERQLAFAETMGRIAGAAPDEQAALLDAARPDPDADGFALAQDRFETLQKAIAADTEQRRKDPAGYVGRVNRPLAEAFEAADTPEAFGRAVTLSLAEQERLGVPAALRRAVPDATVERVAETVQGLAGARDKVARIGAYALGIAEPGPRRAFMADLVKAGLPEGLRFVLPALEAGDEVGAAELLGALEAKITLEGDPKKELRAALEESGETAFETLTAALTGDARPLAEGRERLAAIERLAAARVQAGADPDDAVAHARKVAGGGVARLVDPDLGAITLPGDGDATRIEQGLQRFRHEITEHVDAAVLARMLSPEGQGFEASFARRMGEELLEDMIDGARWLDHPAGGYGLLVTLPDGTTGFLPGADGEAIRLEAAEADKLGGPGWTSFQPDMGSAGP